MGSVDAMTIDLKWNDTQPKQHIYLVLKNNSILLNSVKSYGSVNAVCKSKDM